MCVASLSIYGLFFRFDLARDTSKVKRHLTLALFSPLPRSSYLPRPTYLVPPYLPLFHQASFVPPTSSLPTFHLPRSTYLAPPYPPPTSLHLPRSSLSSPSLPCSSLPTLPMSTYLVPPYSLSLSLSLSLAIRVPEILSTESYLAVPRSPL